MAKILVFMFLALTSFASKCTGFGFIQEFLGDSDSCEDICRNTYSPHTYEESLPLSVCTRGCRLFTIIDFVDEFGSPNETTQSCLTACADSYQLEDELNACSLGCKSQLSTANSRRAEWESGVATPSFSPLIYIHSMYSNMVDKVQNHIAVSWSFYASSDNGQLVVVKSQPVVYMEGPLEYKTSNYMETNLAELDNSATPNLKSSQVLSARERDLGGYGEQEEPSSEQSMDWLGCISKKTGLPRLFITFTVLASAMVMIWLCATSAATAPDQKVTVPKQKLSYYGDMDLVPFDEKMLHHPQYDAQQAGPIPFKVAVERI